MSDDAKWHWGEGNKYVVEGAKSIFLLHGAAAVSILTFIGHSKQHPWQFIAAMGTFASGALVSALIFLFGYRTQLEYGNVGTHKGGNNKWHKGTYGVVAVSVVLFVVGIALAAYGFAATGGTCI